MFSKKAHRRDRTSSSANSPASTVAPPLVSPLRERFSYTDQTSPSPVSPAHASSDFRFSDHGHSRDSSSAANTAPPYRGNVAAGERPQSIISLHAPVLPPIPRVASRYERAGQPVRNTTSQFDFGRRIDEESGHGSGLEERNPETTSHVSRRSDSKPSSSFEPAGRVQPVRPSISTTFSESNVGMQSPASLRADSPRMDVEMQSSLFPGPPEAPNSSVVQPVGESALSRHEVDARDRVYNRAPQRPPMPSTQSSPAVPSSPGLFQNGADTRSPLSPYSATSDNSRQAFQARQANARKLSKAQKGAESSYSGSTARESIQSGDSSAYPQSTVGTPFEETSPSFPLPQHVATRPKTLGSTSSVAGVQVPTHHSHGAQSANASGRGGEKRRTRLLNPMALLTRRRSAQAEKLTEAERAAQDAAISKQQSIAATGVNRLPEDYDPRIRGKTIHDFSAPRPQRNYSHNDAESSNPQNGQSSALPIVQEPDAETEQDSQQASSHGHQRSTDSSRHSRHAPMFFEHFDGGLEDDKRASSVHAESLENREFLQRVSHQSSPSNYSQDSSMLPPFARRSQMMDPAQTSLHDVHNKSSSDPSFGKDRNSMYSSMHEASPVTSRSSGQQGVSPTVDRSSQQHPHGSRDGIGSPVSPRSAGHQGFAGFSDSIGHTSDGKARPESETMPMTSPTGGMFASDTKSISTPIAQPAVPTIDEDRPSSQQSLRTSETSYEGKRVEARSPPTVPASPPIPASPNAALDPISTPQASASSPRFVERRASAVGHSKRSSIGPRHRVSNASRFSFQMGTSSAAEERALEEKHRLAEARGNIAASSRDQRRVSPDEDEDDYFDEDAMDDLDEMEMQDTSSAEFEPHSQKMLQPPTQTESKYLSPGDAGSFSRHDSDQGSVYEDDEPEMERGKGPTQANASRQSHEYASRSLDVDQYLAGDRNSMQTAALNDDARGEGFYMQPTARSGAYDLLVDSNGYVEGSQQQDTNSEKTPHQNRQAHSSNLSASRTHTPAGNGMKLIAQPWTGGWNDFNFDDGPDLSLESSRPTSAQAPPLSPSMDQFVARAKGQSGDWKELTNRASNLSSAKSPTSAQFEAAPRIGNNQSAPYHGAVGRGISVRDPQRMNQNLQYARSEDDYVDDDMYFNDGGFDEDLNGMQGQSNHSVDEDRFDDPAFLSRSNGANSHMSHQRGASAMTFNSLGSDGPYPAFARPNSARQRNSTMLLEDLPLQASGDPRHPQQMSSIEAKRLGLSNKVPPLPRLGSSDGFLEEQANLQAYHAALAEAANKAYAEGRFSRIPSASTTRSGSLYSNKATDEARPISAENRSRYSQSSHDTHGLPDNGNMFHQNPRQARLNDGLGIGRSDSKETSSAYRDNDHLDYSPEKLSFDFGFDRLDFGGNERKPQIEATPSYTNSENDTKQKYSVDYDSYDNDDDDANDDDIIAAANSEALANDADGWYGQEFGFYAKARPDSGDFAEAEMGGFFGELGDDGLLRQKSLREPNLTPITERSEFSTRNSFITLGGMPSAGLHGHMSPALGRLPLSPLAQEAVGADTASYFRKPGAPGAAGGHGYFGPSVFTADLGNSSSSPRYESPHSAASSRSHLGHSLAWNDNDATPRKSPAGGVGELVSTPQTARKVPSSQQQQQQQQQQGSAAASASSNSHSHSHSRSGSSADRVTYVRERDPAGTGQPRWVLERRRTSEQGLEEVVGREVVQGGWI
ncbi:hypothetical protein MBLNU230_g4324t1 [Neophaeotheca triangularis]